MLKPFKQIALPLAILFIITFVLFVINQLSGIFLLLKSYNETIATVTTLLLILVVTGLLLWPLLLFIKLPAPLSLPKNVSDEPKYQQQLVSRLKKTNY